VHAVTFAGLGIVAASLVDATRREPSIAAGLVVLFVVFEVLCTGLIATMAAGSPLHELAWWQIGVANLLAAATMGTYLFKRNPELGTTLEHALSGGAEPA
jgi:hypothetical protein